MKFKKIVIIGIGLIGGSIGKALLKKGIAREVVGVCRRKTSLNRAIKEKVFSRGYINDYGKALSGAEIVILATPVHAIKDVMKKISSVVSPGTIVTDAGSTKEGIVRTAASFRAKFSFVGAHPMAGSEKAGVEFAKSDLFERTLCIITKDRSTKAGDLKKIKALWEALGANAAIMSPGEHDKILSFVSHLPHIVAYSLAGSQKKDFLAFAATGFKDTTRIASSDPALWTAIFMENRKNVLRSIHTFRKTLSGIESDLARGNRKGLLKKLSSCKRMRDELI